MRPGPFGAPGAPGAGVRPHAVRPRAAHPVISVLYISYDGALDPLGNSQVVPYLEGLSRQRVAFDLITFEKPERWVREAERSAMRVRLDASGIRWHPLVYHKSPPLLGTAGDLGRGIRAARRIAEDIDCDLIHARSYPSALMARHVGREFGIPYIFDMRGFYPEERVDGGLWRRGGSVYTVTKRIEADLLRDAGGVVTLTEASLPILEPLMAGVGSAATLAVIPTCADMERFRAAPLPPGPPRLTYVGSVGTWYLLDPMMELACAFLAASPGSDIEFVVNGDPAPVEAAGLRAGLPPGRLQVGSVPYTEVPDVLARSSATFFLIRPGGSKIASAATKFGESLAAGRPVLANEGVGDSAHVIRSDGVGAVVSALNAQGFAEAVRTLLDVLASPDLVERCRASAARRYDLERGVEAYARLYREVLGGRS